MILGRDFKVLDAKGHPLTIGIAVSADALGEAPPGVIVGISEPDESHPTVDVLWPEAPSDNDTEDFPTRWDRAAGAAETYVCDDLERVE